MGIVLQNAVLVDLEPLNVGLGALRIDGERIVQRGEHVEQQVGDEVFDCRGAIVMPGLVNGHTHLYSALAVGMPPPPEPPLDFLQILKSVWWRLDQALDGDAVEMSARIGALDAVRCGTTTLIDHHASPSFIDGALDRVERGIADVGLRAVLCYETTDRHGTAGRENGLEENRRYLAKYRDRRSNQFGGLVGAHASFTLEDGSLDQLAQLAEQFGSGVHIHVAEDPCDEDSCQREYHALLIDRLAGHGLVRAESVFAHCTHLDPDALDRLSRAGLTVAHNPRSNMNNAVGYAPLALMRCPVMLGTDGIGQDMLTEAKQAWYISRHGDGEQTPESVVGMLCTAARRASEILDITLGRLEADSAADLLISDYQPATPLHADNLASHVIFGLGTEHVRDVMVRGRWAVRDRRVIITDEPQWRRSAIEVADRLWERMGDIA